MVMGQKGAPASHLFILKVNDGQSVTASHVSVLAQFGAFSPTKSVSMQRRVVGEKKSLIIIIINNNNDNNNFKINIFNF